jgi:hypothetical protein
MGQLRPRYANHVDQRDRARGAAVQPFVVRGAFARRLLRRARDCLDVAGISAAHLSRRVAGVMPDRRWSSVAARSADARCARDRASSILA